MAYKMKALTCPGATSDENTLEEESKGVGWAGLAASVNTHFQRLRDAAVAQQKAFAAQTCADCDKIKDDEPVPLPEVTSISLVNVKNLTFDVKCRVHWTATVEWKKKAETLKPTNVKVKQAGATGETTIAVIKYQCIDGWLWVLIFNAQGTVELSRERTAEKCPITADNPVQEYGWDAECDGEFWWVILKDPKTGKPILKKRTDSPCKKEDDKDKGKDKGKDK